MVGLRYENPKRFGPTALKKIFPPVRPFNKVGSLSVTIALDLANDETVALEMVLDFEDVGEPDCFRVQAPDRASPVAAQCVPRRQCCYPFGSLDA